uniref:Uncharacterized protein n=1 Tax=Siphoviridae sp. ctwQT14 TaxID=2827971 RepID=A0A8S5TKC3_9CAUD|nr:MAG TPA: hypothetical protein [Siphoviridae sp. ctwQT14]
MQTLFILISTKMDTLKKMKKSELSMLMVLKYLLTSRLILKVNH